MQPQFPPSVCALSGYGHVARILNVKFRALPSPDVSGGYRFVTRPTPPTACREPAERGLLWTDAYDLRTLMMRDSDGMIALLALCAGCIITSASVVAGSAIMMNRNSDDDDDHRGGPGIHELVPVKVRSRS
jgi:hypothetical protein